MRLTILGNGGGISDGLPYNAFLVDDLLLCELPPDIMSSLFREGVRVESVRHIFISHFHADHCFGFPFFALRLFYDGARGPIMVIGPRGVSARMYELCALAFGSNHPLREWLEGVMRFIEIAPDTTIELGNRLSIGAVRMTHSVETFGFSLRKSDMPLFTYMPDTLWNDDLLPHLQNGGKIVLIDLNGDPLDPHRVHLSEDELAEKVIALCAEDIIFYGTHLKRHKETGTGRIRYVRPGDRIAIPE